jgi:hypothetical protein
MEDARTPADLKTRARSYGTALEKECRKEGRIKSTEQYGGAKIGAGEGLGGGLLVASVLCVAAASAAGAACL